MAFTSKKEDIVILLAFPAGESKRKGVLLAFPFGEGGNEVDERGHEK